MPTPAVPAQPPVQDLDEVLARLRAALPELQQRYPIARLGVFGSFARGEQRPDSDVDVLVELNGPLGFEYFKLADEIEHVLGRPISFVSPDALRPWWREAIVPTTVPV